MPARRRGSPEFSRGLVGHTVDIVAVDMPLSMELITARRVSDSKVGVGAGLFWLYESRDRWQASAEWSPHTGKPLDRI